MNSDKQKAHVITKSPGTEAELRKAQDRSLQPMQDFLQFIIVGNFILI